MDLRLSQQRQIGAVGQEKGLTKIGAAYLCFLISYDPFGKPFSIGYLDIPWPPKSD